MVIEWCFSGDLMVINGDLMVNNDQFNGDLIANNVIIWGLMVNNGD